MAAFLQKRELFIAAGIDINLPDSNGDTPLLLAVGRGNAAFVSLALSCGAQQKDAALERCAMRVCQIGQEDDYVAIASELLQKGARPSKLCYQRMCDFSNDAMFKLCNRYFPDTKWWEQSIEGVGPILFYIAQYSDAEFCNARFDESPWYVRNATYYGDAQIACAGEHLTAIEVLLKMGVSPHHRAKADLARRLIRIDNSDHLLLELLFCDETTK